MTKIAVYGDSFASQKIGWPNYLESLYKNSEIDIFGVGGTSPNFSYMRFLETHKKYDLVIFLWTSPTRNALITRNHDTKKYEVHGFTETDCPHETLKENIRQNLKQNLRYNNLIFNDIPEFVNIDEKWILHESVHCTIHESKTFLENLAMRDSVKLRRPDSINIECFENLENFSYGMSNICVSDFYQALYLEYKNELNYSQVLKLQPPHYNDDFEKRPNHLSFKQSKEFAYFLYKHINDRNFDLHKTFQKPEKFYTMSKSFEEGGFLLNCPLPPARDA